VKYTFVNGNARQKELWGAAAHRFLNYAFADIPLDVEVEFIDAGGVTNHGHTDLAITTYTYGSGSSKTVVRNDAPSFGTQAEALKALAASMGVPYSVERFYAETAAHELGHSAFAALTPQLRLAVCRMFGVNTDDTAVLQPAGKPWQQHIAEGIAETFKEAFLPERFRVFPNRTNRRIPYPLFPAFREIFRGGGSGVGAGFSYVYGSDDFRVDLSEWGLTALPYHKSDRDGEAFVFYEGIPDFLHCWGIDMSQFPESGSQAFSIEVEGGITT
jgi:hypothetical protein